MVIVIARSPQDGEAIPLSLLVRLLRLRILAMTGGHFFIHSSTMRCNVPSACIAANAALISATN